MNRLILVIPVVAGAALAAYAMTSGSDPEDDIAVATVQHTSEPAPVLVALPKPVTKPMPSDFPSLAREIQRELRRVGCYRGEINGLWTPSTRAAMKAFVDDANAVLPVDKPDQVLLSLVQGERDTACGSSCPPGQQTQDGACVASTVAANSATVTGSIERKLDAPTEAAHTQNPVPDERPVPASETPRPVETAALDGPTSPSVMESDLVPPPAAYPEKPKHTARYPRNRPPKIVRSFFRSIKRSLAPFGIR